MSKISATAPAIFITVPKYVAITPSTNASSTLPKIRPAPITNRVGNVTPTSSSEHSGYASSVSEDGAATKGKKRRLDHLSWEEKIQRKKLKNRVAAQTSRDRKKARMEDMENEILELTEKTQLLQNKCESMQAINESLLEKNHKLDLELELLRQQLADMQEQQKRQQKQYEESKLTATCAGCESILNGSAVSIYTDDPLQQGSINQMDSQSAQVVSPQTQKTNTIAALWRIIALCLLYKTCSSSTSSTTMKNSMPGGWKNLPKAYSQISQQTWRQAIGRAMNLLPKLQAEQSACLDQWWGPQQSAWNPAKIVKPTTVTA